MVRSASSRVSNHEAVGPHPSRRLASQGPQDEGIRLVLLGMNRFDIVAVRVDQERGKVGRAIILAWTRRAIVAASGLDAFAMEFSDRGMIGRAKGDMGAGAGISFVQIQPQRRLALRPKPRAARIFRAEDV